MILTNVRLNKNEGLFSILIEDGFIKKISEVSVTPENL